MNDAPAALVHFSVSVIGKDRFGIIAEATEILYRLGCNIEDSSCTLLAGDFAMILVASCREPFDKTVLLNEFTVFGRRTGLAAYIRFLAKDELCRQQQDGELCLVSVHGADRSGIVCRVARRLADRQINITDMNTRLAGTPGNPAYILMLEAVLPGGMTLDDVTCVLEDLKKELAIEIGVRIITPAVL